MEDEVPFFYHQVFGPWRINDTEEEVAKVAEELPSTIFFMGPPATEYYTGLAAGVGLI